MFGKVKIGVFDCITGECFDIDQLPFEIGSGEAADLRIFDEGVFDRHCVLMESKGNKYIAKREDDALVLIDGKPVNSILLQPKKDYSLQIGNQLMVFRLSKRSFSLGKRLAADTWMVHDPDSGATDGPYYAETLATLWMQGKLNDYLVTYLDGMERTFYLSQIEAVLESLAPPDLLAEEGAPPQEEYVPDMRAHDGGAIKTQPTTYPTKGDYSCPSCWLPFDAGDVLHIAPDSDRELRSDPVLGEGHLLRFQATVFNGDGQALSPLGTPCTDMACPHCRCQIPTGFLDVPTHIFSIVGAPQAGKSYYLATLIHQLENYLPREFGTSFMNADPKGNALLEQMKTQLFTAETPEDAHLIKTDFEGEMYQTYTRYGAEVRLPRPFTYRVNKFSAPNSACHLTFYDNAGEHFEPNVSVTNNPGALHILTSRAIFFLFDPTYNVSFRKQLSDHHDPQFKFRKLDRQDAILAVMAERFQQLLRMRATERISTPLAMMIGKSDTWLPIIGTDKLRPTVTDGVLDLSAIASNSALIRDFMQDLCPNIVAYADEIAEEVVYFPVSPLGHSPVEFDLGGEKRLGPDPKKINPCFIETPTLWALSKIVPEIIPTHS